MNKRKLLFIAVLVFFIVGCTRGDKEIIVYKNNNCDFSKKLVLIDNETNYYTSCLNDVIVKYSVDSKKVSLFDEIKSKKMSMEELYDRSLDVIVEDNITTYEFSDYYILKCDNNIVFGNIDNAIDKTYCLLKDSEIVSLYDLDNDYSYEDAIDDNYYVVTSNKVYNSDTMKHFLDGISLNQPSFIRITNVLSNDSMTITDVLVVNGKVTVTIDNTRSSTVSEKNIKTYNFSNIGTYEDEVGKYLYAYDTYSIDDDSLLITNIIIEE